jgi:formylmethanofuran dehydrogenase subunit E
MSDYKCECNGKTIDKRSVTIRCIEGKGVIHDVKCEECGEYMIPIKKERNYTKEGVASLGRMNRNGSSY